MQSLATRVLRRLRVHQERDDKPIQTQHFREDEDKDHADEEAGLLGSAADAGVADDADCESVVVKHTLALPEELEEVGRKRFSQD